MLAFSYLKALWSPFRPFKLKWYCGKIAVGTPYFFPRRWVKPTHKMAAEAAMRNIAEAEDWNERNPNAGFKRSVRDFDSVYQQMLATRFAVPKHFGFDFIQLGWKTKWTPTDIRFEWQPGISFVCWKWQIAVLVTAPEPDHYWSAWLYYELHTDKTKSKSERIAQCRKEFSQTYRVSKNGVTKQVDYYDVILRKKYCND